MQTNLNILAKLVSRSGHVEQPIKMVKIRFIRNIR